MWKKKDEDWVKRASSRHTIFWGDFLLEVSFISQSDPPISLCSIIGFEEPMDSIVSHRHGGWSEGVAAGGYWVNSIFEASYLEMISDQGTFMVTKPDQGVEAVT